MLRVVSKRGITSLHRGFKTELPNQLVHVIDRYVFSKETLQLEHRPQSILNKTLGPSRSTITKIFNHNRLTNFKTALNDGIEFPRL